ncbi:hypothetical protein F2P56_002441 [Juglans regia]|uniref:Uncharacterized protein n=1 Tax=Juglans regia TaxID=51240 RepID=A0A833YF66_JUGRE|nr:hypothetical protein F2P56_002441 [Juglans regia]
MQIRTQQATATKGSKTATKYSIFIKKLTYELSVARQPMSCEDVITYVLAGLSHEYDSFVASISAHTDKVTMEEIYSLLLTTEARLSRHQMSSPAQPTSVNVAQRQYNPSQNRGRGDSRGRGRSNRTGYNNTTRNTDYNSVIYQVCNKPGHLARKCYFQFDLSYQDPKPENKQAMIAIGTWDTKWHADTGATHHVTNDLNNLNLQNDDY